MYKHGLRGKTILFSFNRLGIFYIFFCSRQCMCCYRDPKNFDRFSCITQSIIYLTVCHLKEFGEKPIKNDEDKSKCDDKEKIKDLEDNLEELQDKDKLYILTSKIFLLNFPLYVAFKHTSTNKLDDLTQQEMQNLNAFCDLHDSEIPIYLLRNVTFFCKIGGVHAMTACFTNLLPEELPVSTAHAMISIGERTFLNIFM